MSTSTTSRVEASGLGHPVGFVTAHRRTSGTLLILGAFLLAAGNALHPVDADPSATSRLVIADASAWVPVHLMLAVGFLVIAAGVVTLVATFRIGAAQAVGRVAGIAALAGGTLLFAVFGGLDGYAMSSLAGRGAAGIEPAVIAVDAVDTGLAAMGTLALLGFAMLLLGVAARMDRGLPAWMGWTALFLGVGGTVTGVALVNVGATDTTINILLRPVGLATTLFFLALGVTLWRFRRLT